VFRLKIALFSVLISGSVLVVFGLFFLAVISKIGLERIDREILTLGESQLHVWHPKKHWQDFAQSLRSIYGQDHWKDLIVQVTDVDQQVLYRSPHWPEEVATASFPDFDNTMATGPDAHALAEGPRDRPSDSATRPERGRDSRPLPGRRQPHPGGDGPGRPPPPPQRPPAPVHIKQPSFITMETTTATWRTGILGNQYITIILGLDMAGFYEDADRYRKSFLFSVPLALLLIAAGGWWIAHRALKPVTLITRTTENISARGLDRRIPESGADSELLRLIKVINKMLDRLEKSFGQAVRFSADAAHELQTPLTILQGVLDDAVQNSANGSAEQRRSSDLLEEVQRLKVIVQKLLLLSRVDAGQLTLHMEPLSMSTMIESIIEDVEIIAPHLKIEHHISPKVMVQADPPLLRQVIQNLTSNAIKYNLDEGLIKFRLRQQGKNIQLQISNTGIPIPDKDRERIFDRFYRIDKSRSNRVPGSGLGLALAREIVRAHKGRLRLETTMDNLITFTLTLSSSQ
jgi:two-component system, OmpR family, heavy metal sensor histidine kinase CusS